MDIFNDEDFKNGKFLFGSDPRRMKQAKLRMRDHVKGQTRHFMNRCMERCGTVLYSEILDEIVGSSGIGRIFAYSGCVKIRVKACAYNKMAGFDVLKEDMLVLYNSFERTYVTIEYANQKQKFKNFSADRAVDNRIRKYIGFQRRNNGNFIKFK